VGAHAPNLETLRKIAAVLDEELFVCLQRNVDGEIERDFAAVAQRPGRRRQVDDLRVAGGRRSSRIKDSS
jgi:hypothetical protein